MSNKNNIETSPNLTPTSEIDSTFYFSGYNVSVKAETLAEAHAKLAKLLESITNDKVETILKIKTN